jgi:hypothetical protein
MNHPGDPHPHPATHLRPRACRLCPRPPQTRPTPAPAAPARRRTHGVGIKHTDGDRECVGFQMQHVTHKLEAHAAQDAQQRVSTQGFSQPARITQQARHTPARQGTCSTWRYEAVRIHPSVPPSQRGQTRPRRPHQRRRQGPGRAREREQGSRAKSGSEWGDAVCNTVTSQRTPSTHTCSSVPVAPRLS